MPGRIPKCFLIFEGIVTRPCVETLEMSDFTVIAPNRCLSSFQQALAICSRSAPQLHNRGRLSTHLSRRYTSQMRLQQQASRALLSSPAQGRDEYPCASAAAE